METADR